MSMWRYEALLPVVPGAGSRPGLQPGLTTLVRADNLAAALGARAVWVKDDSGNPTHSFKDRVVAVALENGRGWATRPSPAPPRATSRMRSPQPRRAPA